MRKFYNACDCKNGCYDKVIFSQALDTYRTHSKMKNDELFFSLGALVRASRRVDAEKSRNSNGEKESYNWKIGKAKVCKDFFAIIYNVTVRQLERLQVCIKGGKPLGDQRGGDNVTPESVQANVKLFLNNYLKDLILPSPSDDTENLPNYLNYKEMHKGLCQYYLQEFGVGQPMCHPSFINYFKKGYDHVGAKK